MFCSSLRFSVCLALLGACVPVIEDKDADTGDEGTTGSTGEDDLDGGDEGAWSLGSQVVTMGVFTTTATGADLGYAASGRAMIVRDGVNTTVYTQLLGMDPETSYMAHVHEYPCDVLSAGAHYKIDPTEAGTVRANEIWPSFTTDANGEGLGFDSVVHDARPDAQSVVVHDPATGARVACATLTDDAPGATVYTGDFFKLASASSRGYCDLQGVGQLVRSGAHTYATVRIEGLDSNADYPVHVHRYSCDVNDAGPHYKFDPGESGTVRENEIWPAFTTDDDGLGEGSDDVQHVARPDAMAIVLHDTDGTKLACADLEGAVVPYETNGNFLVTATGLERGYGIVGNASLVRTLDGDTSVVATVSGLDPNTTFMAHVHREPCRTGGGAHYKIDDSISEEIRENEIWPMFMADAAGNATGTDVALGHLARPEAQSIVIHDPSDKARLACADLD